MKTLLSLLLVLLVVFQPQAANIQIPVRNLVSGIVSNRRVTLTLLQPGVATAGPWALVGDSFSLQTDVNGYVTFTNVLAGGYRLDIAGNPPRSFGIGVPDTNGVIPFASIVGSTNITPYFFSAQQIEAGVWVTNYLSGFPNQVPTWTGSNFFFSTPVGNGDVLKAANQTFTGTNTMQGDLTESGNFFLTPNAGTTNYVLTLINTNGKAQWLPSQGGTNNVGGVSVAGTNGIGIITNGSLAIVDGSAFLTNNYTAPTFTNSLTINGANNTATLNLIGTASLGGIAASIQSSPAGVAVNAILSATGFQASNNGQFGGKVVATNFVGAFQGDASNATNYDGTNIMRGPIAPNVLSPTNGIPDGYALTKDHGTNLWAATIAGGTVTSVGGSGNNGIRLTGGPITTSGTLTASTDGQVMTNGMSVATTFSNTVAFVDSGNSTVTISNGTIQSKAITNAGPVQGTVVKAIGVPGFVGDGSQITGIPQSAVIGSPFVGQTNSYGTNEILAGTTVLRAPTNVFGANGHNINLYSITAPGFDANAGVFRFWGENGSGFSFGDASFRTRLTIAGADNYGLSIPQGFGKTPALPSLYSDDQYWGVHKDVFLQSIGGDATALQALPPNPEAISRNPNYQIPTVYYTSWYLQGTNPSSATATNLLGVYKTNLLPYILAAGGTMTYEVDGGAFATTYDVNGAPQLNAARFPEGPQWLINWVGTNGFQFELFHSYASQDSQATYLGVNGLNILATQTNIQKTVQTFYSWNTNNTKMGLRWGDVSTGVGYHNSFGRAIADATLSPKGYAVLDNAQQLTAQGVSAPWTNLFWLNMSVNGPPFPPEVFTCGNNFGAVDQGPVVPSPLNVDIESPLYAMRWTETNLASWGKSGRFCSAVYADDNPLLNHLADSQGWYAGACIYPGFIQLGRWTNMYSTNVTWQLITNVPLMSVYFDSNAVPGFNIYDGGRNQTSVWARVLYNKDTYVELANETASSQNMGVSWAQLAAKCHISTNSVVSVYDLLAKSGLGNFSVGYTNAALAAHSVGAYRLTVLPSQYNGTFTGNGGAVSNLDIISLTKTAGSQGQLVTWNAGAPIWSNPPSITLSNSPTQLSDSAVTLNGNLVDGQVLTYNASMKKWTNATPGSGGTVTSVGFSAPGTGLTVSGSPITTSGTLTLTSPSALVTNGFTPNMTFVNQVTASNVVSTGTGPNIFGATNNYFQGQASFTNGPVVVTQSNAASGFVAMNTNGTLWLSNNPGSTAQTIYGSNIFVVEGSQQSKAMQVDTNGTTWLTKLNVLGTGYFSGATIVSNTLSVSGASQFYGLETVNGTAQFFGSIILSNNAFMDASHTLSLSNGTASSLAGFNASKQVATVDLTGDVTTSGSLATTMKNTGTAGTYRSVTFDAQGRETSGSNPTTFAGYAISDTSANLASALTDKTGTGSAVFGTGPTIITPTISGTETNNGNLVVTNLNTAQSGMTLGTNASITISTNIAPGTAPGNNVVIYADVADGNFKIKQAGSGSVAVMVNPAGQVSHQFFNALSANGVLTDTQPAFTDISGAATLAQIPSALGSVYTTNITTITNWIYDSFQPPSGAWMTNGEASPYTPASAVTLNAYADTLNFQTNITNGVHFKWWPPSQAVVSNGFKLSIEAYCTGTNAAAAACTNSPVSVGAAQTNGAIFGVAMASITNGTIVTNLTYGTAVYMTNHISTNAYAITKSSTGIVTPSGTNLDPTNAIMIHVWMVGTNVYSGGFGTTVTNGGVNVSDFRVEYTKAITNTAFQVSTP